MRLFSRHLLTAEVYTDHFDQIRFRIKSRNGEIILTSEGYTRKASAMKTLQLLQNHGLTLNIKDITT